MSDRDARLRAAAVLARALGTPSFRYTFHQSGYQSTQQIVIALDDDSVESVLAKCHEFAPPVLICVFNESQDQLKFLSAEPGHGSAEQHGSSEVGRTSTIGMLLEYLERRGAPFTFRLSTPTDTAGIDITRMALSVQ